MLSRCYTASPALRKLTTVSAAQNAIGNSRRSLSNSSSSSSHTNFNTNNNNRSWTRRFASQAPLPRDPGLALTSVLADPKEVDGPPGVPSRTMQLQRLSDPTMEYDVVVVGGGATGAGIAFDAATRGLKVACIERGDFASETSSRSTKLIWAGIRYMATASAALLSPKLLTSPVVTVKDFLAEMKMVLQCHRERHYMTVQQAHLVNWVPIAIPFTRWHVSPPPFGHPLFGFFPVLAPMVLKFYDSLSGFSCPPSYILRPSVARREFPQLADQNIKYCAVFYEAQHNDARTNIAIAMSAAQYGAHIANYVEMTNVIKDKNSQSGKVVGIEATDRMTGKTFTIAAKKVVFAGGPFTDALRDMETATDKEIKKPAVQGAAGTHIVLPGYFLPNDVRLTDCTG
jgi:glycerol-3-phosphate dehydrogenase